MGVLVQGVLVQRFSRYARLLAMRRRRNCYAASCVQRRPDDKTWKSTQNPASRRLDQLARSATLHVISLAQLALAYTRGWAANSQVARVRLQAENDRLR